MGLVSLFYPMAHGLRAHVIFDGSIVFVFVCTPGRGAWMARGGEA